MCLKSDKTIIDQPFTRALTVEQINGGEHGNNEEGHRELFFREASIGEVDEENRTVALSFSSETPVERWFGEEILDHSPGAMRDGRLNDGGALLVNHSWDDQVGVVESVSVGDDRKGRAVVRFGNSVRAEEIFQDVIGRIRKHVSVGYFVKKIQVEEREGQVDQVLVLDWEPYEISIVAVPADTSVGFGRGKEQPPKASAAKEAETSENDVKPAASEPKMKTKIVRNAKGDLVRVSVDESGSIVEELEVLEVAGSSETALRESGSAEGVAAERARVSEIGGMARQFSGADIAAEHIERGSTVDEFRQALLERTSGSKPGKIISDGDAEIGLSDKEVRGYSFLRVARALANPTSQRAQEDAAFEFEASAAAAERTGKVSQGCLVPVDVLSRAMNTGTGGAAAGDTGGFSIATELQPQSFINALRNRSVMIAMARPLAGLTGDVLIPRQISGANGYWLDEDEDSSETGSELDQIELKPRTVGAFTELTRKLLQQTTLDLETFVRDDLAMALALTIDRAALYGDGVKRPLGIASAVGINVVEFVGDDPDHAELVDMETAVGMDNALVERMKYILHSKGKGKMKTTQKAAGTDGSMLWESGDTLNSYGSEVTNQIDVGDYFFGNFDDLIFATWGGLDLTVDTSSGSKSGRVRLVAFKDLDFGHRRLESFCLGRKAVA